MTTGIKDLLNRQAGALIYYKPSLVEISSTTTVADALKLLAERNILAVPVFDNEKQEYVGVVHTFDFLLYIAFGFFKVEETPVTPESLQEHIDKIRDLPAKELIGIAHYSKAGWWHNGMVIYEPTRSISDLLSPLGGGLERVLVRGNPSASVAAEGNSEEMHEGHDSALRILSQSDIVRYLLLHPASIQDLASKTLDQLGLASDFNQFQKVVTIRETDSALLGFRRMYVQEGDAVAVVNEQGSIVANLSASDLRGLKLEDFKLLLQPVTRYLRLRSRSHLPAPLTVSGSDTLQQAMVLAVCGHVHRLWVVAPDTRKPIGVLRLTDILKQFQLHP